MTADIHLTLASWNILATVEKTTSPLCALPSGHFPSEQVLHHSHCTSGVQSDMHCVAGHGARETQGPEPGFARVGSLAQVSNVGIHSAQERVRWNREKEIRPFGSFSCCYTWALLQKHQCFTLGEIFFSQKLHKMRTEDMELTIHKIYTVLAVNIEVEQVRKGKKPLNRRVGNVFLTDFKGPLGCLSIVAQEIRLGLGLMISYLLSSFKNMAIIQMFKSPKQEEETWAETRGKGTSQNHSTPHHTLASVCY